MIDALVLLDANKFLKKGFFMKKSNRKKFDWYNACQRFSIRKYHFGAASVLLGTALVLGLGTQTVQADESAEKKAEVSQSDTTAVDGSQSSTAPSSQVYQAPASVIENTATQTAPAKAEAPALVKVDKSALDAAITKAKTASLLDKTDASIQAFNQALANAEAVLSDARASQETVAEAVESLTKAQEGLTDKPKTEGAVLSETKETPAKSATAEKGTTKAEDKSSVNLLAPKAEKLESTSNQSLSTESTTTPASATETKVNRRKRSLTETPAEDPATNQMKVQYFTDPDARNEISESDVWNLTSNTNVKLYVKVTFPADGTQKTVTIKGGPYVSILDYGKNDSTVLTATSSRTMSPRTENTSTWTTSEGREYTTSETTGAVSSVAYGDSVTYAVKDEITSLLLPLNLNIGVDTLGLRGLSSDGSINGSSAGVERAAAITTTVKTTLASGEQSVVTELAKTSLADDLNKRQMYTWFSASASPNPVATTDNDYTAVLGMLINYSPLKTQFTDRSSFDLVLPKGVSYVEHNGNYFKVVSSVTQEDGSTRVSFVSTKGWNKYLLDFLPKIKIDRSIVTGDSARIAFENYAVTLRNHTAESSLEYTKDLATTKYYNVPIVDLTDQDDIAFLQANPGVQGGRINAVDTKPQTDANNYVPLAALPYDVNITNLDAKQSREKELDLVFQQNEYTEVKGFALPLINNGTTVSTVKIRSKNNPNLREVQLSKTYTVRDSGRFIDLKELGLDEDDALLEAVVPFGSLEANKSYVLSGLGSQKQTFVFGKVLKSPTTQTNVVTTKLFLRDKDYDANDENHNYILGPGDYSVNIGGASLGRDDVYMQAPNSTTVDHGKATTITYRLRSDTQSGNHWLRSSNEIERAYLVFPKDTPLSDFRVSYKGTENNTNVDITNEVAVTNEEKDGNVVYKLDFSKVNDKHNQIGWIARYGQPFNMWELQVSASVTNNVEQKKILPLNQTMFAVTTTSARPAVATNTVRGVDPYNLEDDDSKLYTTFATTNTITFPKADKLDFKTEAKLSNESEYASNETNKYKITDLSQSLDLKWTISNTLDKEIGEVDMVIAVPKEGENWGNYIQSEKFKYGLALSKVTLSNGFSDTFDISYSDGAGLAADGSTNYTLKDFKNLNFTKTPSSFADVKFVRITSKSGVKLKANSSYVINANMGLSGIRNENDGQTITWNPRYSAKYDTYSTEVSAESSSLDVALGRMSLENYIDANQDKSKGSTETSHVSGVRYTVYDQNDTKVTEGVLSDTTYSHIVGLVAGRNYRVRFTNPDLSSYRFTTGEVDSTKTFTEVTIGAKLTNESNTTISYVGLTNKKTTYNFTSSNGTLSSASASGFYDDAVTSPTVTAQAGYTFVGWREAGTTAVIRATEVNTKLFGATDKTYEAVYIKSQKTVVANLNWTSGPATHPSVTVELYADGTRVDSKTLPNGTTQAQWTGLDGTKNYTVKVVDLPTYTEDVTEDSRLTRALPTDLVKWAATATAPYAYNVETVTYQANLAYEVQRGDVIANIVWNNAPSTNKPSTSVTLKNGSETIETKALDSGVNTATFSRKELTTADGSPIVYSLEAADLANYSKQVSYEQATRTFTVTYTYTGNKAIENTPVVPSKTEVKDATGLTPKEKAAVKEALLTANSTNADVKAANIVIADDGTATVLYSDTSSDVIQGSELVKERPALAKPVITPVDSDDTVITGTGVPGATVTVTLPTGPVTAKVNAGGTWNLPLAEPIASGTVVTATQESDTSKPSAPVSTTVAKTTAETSTLSNPAVTPVKDATALTKAERAAVVDAIKAANTSNPAVQGAKIEVSEDGTATLTYSDKSVATLTPDLTVKENAPLAQPTIKPVDSDDTVIKGTGAQGATVTVTLPSGPVTAKVDGKGEWKVPLSEPIASGTVVTATQESDTNKPSAPATTTVAKTTAETTTLSEPAKTPVKDATALTKAERAAVVEAIKAANVSNPAVQGANIEVSENGTATITYPDKSVATLTPDKTVKENAPLAQPTIDSVDSDDTVIKGTGAQGATVTVTLPSGPVTAKVNADGTWKLPLAEPVASGTVVTATQESDTSKPSAPVSTIVVQVPKVTPVKDSTNLTKEEQDKVKEDVKKANPTATDVTVGKDGTATVTFPDGTTATITPDKTVKPADSNGVQEPSTKTPVKDSTNLTKEEQDKVKEDVKKANPTATDVTVGKDGTATVTFPDGTTATITPDKTVKPADSNGVQEPSTKTPDKTVKPADSNGVQAPSTKTPDKTVKPADSNGVQKPSTATPVKDSTNLTKEEQDKVKEDVKKANPTATDVTVGKDGTATVTFPDGTTATITPDKTVKPADSNGVQEPSTKTPVKDPANLTEDEKAKVAEDVKKANPTATDVKVNNDGSVVVTFADGSVAVLASEKVVKEATKESSAKESAKKAGAKELPNTGAEQSNASLGLALLAAVTGGLLISKKRKEEE